MKGKIGGEAIRSLPVHRDRGPFCGRVTWKESHRPGNLRDQCNDTRFGLVPSLMSWAAPS